MFLCVSPLAPDIYAEISDSTPQAIASSFATSQMSAFKEALAQKLIAHLAPISEQLRRHQADEFKEVCCLCVCVCVCVCVREGV